MFNLTYIYSFITLFTTFFLETAGRVGPGHCYRLYSSAMYNDHFSTDTLPEILQRPIEDVILTMKAMEIKNISTFPFPTVL